MRPETIRREHTFFSNDQYHMNIDQKVLLSEVEEPVLYIGKTRYVAVAVEYGGYPHRCSTSLAELAANGGYFGDDEMYAFPATVVYRRADRRY